MKPLTAKQRDILNFIMDSIEQNGYPPSIREMMTQFKISTFKGITNHLEPMVKKGYIKRGCNAREITILKDSMGNNTILRYMPEDGL